MNLAHLDDYFETPLWLFNQIEEQTGLKFDIDASANKQNSKCDLYISEEINSLKYDWLPQNCLEKVDGALEKTYRSMGNLSIFLNPPRSKNSKFVGALYRNWEIYNVDIVALLCWNDLGNKYGEKLLPHILNGEIIVGNLGKIKFDKNGIESKYPSRLTYFWAWFKKRDY